MDVRLHGIPEEIRVGDMVETEVGVGVVTRVSEPVREHDKAKLEIELGHKWLNVDQVRSIVHHMPAFPARTEPDMHWDEHE